MVKRIDEGILEFHEDERLNNLRAIINSVELKNRYILVVLAVIIIFGDNACSGGATRIPSVTSIPTTYPLLPSSSFVLQSNPTPHPAQTQAQTPTPLMIPTSVNAVVEESLKDCWDRNASLDQMSKVSPDGQWVAAGCFDLVGPLANERPYIEIVQLGGSKKWKYSFEELTGTTPCVDRPDLQTGGDCYVQVDWLIDHWSANSRYVLYTIDLVYGRNVATHFYFGLYRVDTQTGAISAWLPFTGRSYFFAFSPDENYLAYATGVDGYRLHINAIQTGTSTEILLPGLIASLTNIVWSPDSKAMAVSALYDLNGGLFGKSSLFMISLPAMKLNTLISDDPRSIYPESWKSDNILSLLISDNGKYLYDLTTHELIPVK